MRYITLVLLLGGLLCTIPLCAAASVVDATAAEQAYQSGDFAAAKDGFTAAVSQFRAASKDSGDYRVYREAMYLYDRLADCSFTQRDWPALKLYMDGLMVVGESELNLAQTQLSGALASGIAYATAEYLRERVDESVRIASIIQLKRSLSLLLLDSQGEGATGEAAIAQYQALAAALQGVVTLQDGYYVLDVPTLEKKLDQFDAIFGELEKLGDMQALWKKYPPEGSADADKPAQPAEPEGGAETPAGGK